MVASGWMLHLTNDRRRGLIVASGGLLENIGIDQSWQEPVHDGDADKARASRSKPGATTAAIPCSSALRQSFEFLTLQHAFRIADDPGLRYTLAHSTFFHNWFASYKGYDLGRWGDGDDFLVNDIGHPLQGAVASRIFIQNSPGAGSRKSERTTRSGRTVLKEWHGRQPLKCSGKWDP